MICKFSKAFSSELRDKNTIFHLAVCHSCHRKKGRKTLLRFSNEYSCLATLGDPESCILELKLSDQQTAALLNSSTGDIML